MACILNKMIRNLIFKELLNTRTVDGQIKLGQK
jgi:hypothetical protein